MLPFSEVSRGAICTPAEGGCDVADRGASAVASKSLVDASEDDTVPDFRLTAFWIGLCFTLANGPALLGVAAFLLLDFRTCAAAGSDSEISSPSMSVSADASRGEWMMELGAVLGVV